MREIFVVLFFLAVATWLAAKSLEMLTLARQKREQQEDEGRTFGDIANDPYYQYGVNDIAQDTPITQPNYEHIAPILRVVVGEPTTDELIDGGTRRRLTWTDNR